MSGMFASIPAALEDVEVFGKSLTAAYLHCRVWGHDPEPHNIVVAKDIAGVPNAHWDGALLCSHGCGVRWRVLVSMEGEVLRRRLDYSGAPGYVSEVGRIDANGKQILRRQFFVGHTTTRKPARKRKAH